MRADRVPGLPVVPVIGAAEPIAELRRPVEKAAEQRTRFRRR